MRQTLRARYVFPVEGEPIRDGVVEIAGQRIDMVSRGAASGAIDLGNVAIIPGLVNAHTHLEYSGLAAPLGQSGQTFSVWLRQIIGLRRAGGIRPEWTGVGLLEAVRSGTTTLGEIASSTWPPAAFEQSALTATVFYELLGLSPERIEPLTAAAREHLSEAPSSHIVRGLTPHAPYTVHPELLGRAVALCEERNAPLAFHLAESREELQLLATGAGPIVELFEELGVWRPHAIPHGSRPLDYLRTLARAPRTLLAHGNYLVADEIDFLAQHADRMTVIYCPRTHAYFAHEAHPLERLLAAGASVALGTDSRASNPDLSMLSELRLVADRYPRLPGRQVLELGTLAGARALGQAPHTGSLLPGKFADLAIVDLPEHDASDPHELLLAGELPVSGTIWRGSWVFGGERFAEKRA